MKKITKLLTSLVLALGVFTSILTFGACDSSKVIKVCASDVPHAEVLNECVKDILAEQGYKLKVKVLDWTIQNDSVANGDYDANYFQHVPYLNTYSGEVALFASCKVHYEPLGIYYGKVANGTPLTSGTTFAICNDTSNAIRAFQLLKAKGVLTQIPVSADGESLTLSETATYWTSGNITVNLVAENLLVSVLSDNDFVCLPCNTAYTGNINSTRRAAVEDDPTQVAAKANVIAARTLDYENDPIYKAKIDALTDAMLSTEVSNYFATKYLGAMTCDSTSQIDLR